MKILTVIGISFVDVPGFSERCKPLKKSDKTGKSRNYPSSIQYSMHKFSCKGKQAKAVTRKNRQGPLEKG